MYAHQIIETFEHLYSHSSKSNIMSYPDETIPFCEQMTKLIKSAIKFHLPDRVDLSNLLGSRDANMSDVFMGNFSGYCKSPYPLCWFDFCTNPRKISYSADKIPINKSGILVRELKFKNNGSKYWELFIFDYFPDLGFWAPPIAVHYATPGKPISENTEFIELIKKKEMQTNRKLTTNDILEKLRFDQTTWSFATPFYHELAKKFGKNRTIKQEGDSLRSNVNSMRVLYQGLALLNCKNIKTIKIFPNKKHSKARMNRKKKPLFEYKILVLDGTITGDRKKINKTLGSHYRKHFCRGHLKEYTEDKPLFGKIAGLIWWDAHLRGRDKKGFIHKDYKIGI